MQKYHLYLLVFVCFLLTCSTPELKLEQEYSISFADLEMLFSENKTVLHEEWFSLKIILTAGDQKLNQVYYNPKQFCMFDMIDNAINNRICF